MYESNSTVYEQNVWKGVENRNIGESSNNH